MASVFLFYLPEGGVTALNGFNAVLGYGDTESGVRAAIKAYVATQSGPQGSSPGIWDAAVAVELTANKFGHPIMLSTPGLPGIQIDEL